MALKLLVFTKGSACQVPGSSGVRKIIIFLMVALLVLHQLLFSSTREITWWSTSVSSTENGDDDASSVAFPYFYPKRHNRSEAFTFHHPRNHPRVGARFQNGSFGYVVDPYLVRRHFLERMINSSSTPRSFLPLTSEEYEQICNRSVGTGLGEASLNDVRLLRPVKVVMHEEPHPRQPGGAAGRRQHRRRRRAPKILCVLYTYGDVAARVTAIGETWGWRCDGFFAASTITVTDPTQPGFGSVDLVHLFEESYDSMWQKTRSIIAYIYEHFLDDFDYFHVSGDDVHIIPENYRHFLSSLETALNVTGRSRVMHIGRLYQDFIGGGPGYGLSAEAVRFYNEESGLMDDCEALTRSSAEDIHITRCLQSKFYSSIVPANHLITGVPLLQDRGAAWIVSDAHGRHNPTPEAPYIIVPENDVSNETYGWHLMERQAETHAVTMKRYHAHFYRFCPDDSIRARSMLSEDFLKPNVTVQ